MASGDVDLLRAGFERLGADGFESMVPLVHPDFVMETPPGMAAEPQRYEGREGFRRWWTSFYEAMEVVALEPKAFHDLGPERVAIENRMRAVGGTSGIETTREIVLVVSLRDKMMVRIDFYETLAEATPGGHS
ncbi:MAG: nuclear transport factor 2 family protein [Actinomycetota bacterium]|nr:nuclear transport factor 2 family protein [Actinomycetota bacterium]